MWSSKEYTSPQKKNENLKNEKFTHYTTLLNHFKN